MILRIHDLVIERLPEGTPVTDAEEIGEVRPFIPAMVGYTRKRGDYSFLTGPEIGLAKRVIVTYIEGDYARIYINPTIEGVSEEHQTQKRHEHVNVHAYNLKWEQFLLSTDSGYYKGREDVGADLAQALQDAMEILDSYPQ